MFRFAFLVFFKPGCGSVRSHLKRVATALNLAAQDSSEMAAVLVDD